MPPPPLGKNQLKKPEIILEKSCAKNHNLKKKVSREHSSPACVLLVLMCGIGWNKLSTQPCELNFEFSAGNKCLHSCLQHFCECEYGVFWHSSPTYKDCM